MTPAEATPDLAPDPPIEYEIWRCHRARGAWVRAGRYPTRAEALRATPNRGRAPGWVVLPARARPAAGDA